jgi:hypothetical protein
VTSLRHRERICGLLTACGFSIVPGYREPQLVLEKRGEEVSFLFVTRHCGVVVVPGYESWPFEAGAFPETPKTLGGVSCRVVAVAELLHEKLHHEEWSGRSLRPKDRESIQLLRRLAS